MNVEDVASASGDQLRAELAAIGRPGVDFSSFKNMLASGPRMRAWDEANPEAYKLHVAIVAELDARQKFWEQQDAEQRAMQRVLQRLENSGAGVRTIADARVPEETQALKYMREWLLKDPRKTWCILSGGYGTGKTVAATWALKRFATEGKTIAFRHATQVARLSQFDAGAEELGTLRHVHALVLDDFGAEHLGKYAEGVLSDLMATRHANLLPTIITTNLKAGDFKKLGGSRLTDRWAEDGCFYALVGTSLRRKVEQKS